MLLTKFGKCLRSTGLIINFPVVTLVLCKSRHLGVIILETPQVPIVVTLVPRPKKDGFMLYAQGTEECMVRLAEYLKGAL